MPPPPPRPDIDPALAARLKKAAPGERVEALLLLDRTAAASLEAGPAREAGSPQEATLDEPALPQVVQRALGPLAPHAVEVRVFPTLGALFVAGPADLVRRLVNDPDVASATLPDHSE